MNLDERIARCARLIESMTAELSGLRSVKHNFPDASHCYEQPHERDGYARGREEALSILKGGDQ